jgi:cobalt/nickel transport system permease protein
MELNYFKSVDKTDTLFGRLDGRMKTVLFMVGIVVSAFVSRWYLAAALLIAAFAAYHTLRLPWRHLFLRLTLPFGIAWLVFLSLIFTNGSHPLLVVMRQPFALIIYAQGIKLGFLMMLRIMAAVTLAGVLSFSTPMVEILETFRAVKLPGIMVDIADLMVRYVFLLNETARNMRRAQISRTTGRLPWLEQVRNTGKVAGYVLSKSLDRSVKIYNAMLARGYNEENAAPVYFTRPVSAPDLRRGILLIAFPVTILLLNYII